MKNSSQMITARQGNRIMILEIFSAAAMFLPQIALQKSYHFRNCCGGHGKCDGRNLFVDRRSCSKRGFY